MIPSARYPAKLLLFGEYSVLRASDALACPLHFLSGALKYACVAGKDGLKTQKSQQSLIQLSVHLEKIKTKLSADESFDSNRFRNDLISGLIFESDIPEKYGIGSSGALVAAVYSSYFDQRKEKPLNQILESLKLLESFYHNYSSGIDPLVSFLSKSVLIKNTEPVIVPFNLNWLNENFGLYLIDTGQSSSTKEKNNKAFLDKISKDYIQLNNKIIDKVISRNPQNLFSDLLGLCSTQHTIFEHLFPENILQLCRRGTSSSEYGIKLCGSGGGGYFLLFSSKPKHIPDEIIDSGLSIIPL